MVNLGFSPVPDQFHEAFGLCLIHRNPRQHVLMRPIAKARLWPA